MVHFLKKMTYPLCQGTLLQEAKPHKQTNKENVKTGPACCCQNKLVVISLIQLPKRKTRTNWEKSLKGCPSK